jgi:DNA polymerase-3 subunit delta'
VDPEGVQIRIDRVREAILFGAGRPYEAQRRVCRVARADLLGLPAGNALLKSLEEPGSRLHWILTTSRPETLLPTIRSRCVVASVAAPALVERVEQWRSRGRSPEDAEDLARLCGEPEEATEEELASARELRSEITGALRSGLVGRDLFALLLLAENLARVDRSTSRLLAELLADGAVLAAGGSGEFLRHRPSAGPLSEIAQRIGSGPLREAAALAVDEPPDNRFGNRRLHFEAVLLGLYRAATE